MTQKTAKNRLNTLSLKLSLLVLIIILAADVLSFTATIVIDMILGGTSDTVSIISSIISSIIIGSLLSIIVGNIVLTPLSALIDATKKVAGGDYGVQVEMGWSEKVTVREIAGLIKVFNDMTEKLSGIEIFRKDFISNFSHEFKTPLVSIHGFARQLYSGGLSPERQKEFSKIILDETEYLSVLSSNTLLLSSLENRDITADNTSFSLDEQLRGCMLRLEPLWSEKNIDIQMELEEVCYFGNEQLLSHVWSNLFDNAVKFTPNNGAVYVECAVRGEKITVTVRDNGAGIPERSLAHIFDKFYQADASHATKGNGLGLSLVKKIVELCGGSVEVSSVLGEGTTFIVTLNKT